MSVAPPHLHALGWRLFRFSFRGVKIRAGRDGGLLLAPDSTNLRNRDLIIALAARHHIPVVYPERNQVAAGGLMTYGSAALVEPFRHAATYIDSILRGEWSAELPV